MPRATFLIGLPGSGKSTWAAAYAARAACPTALVSTDAYVEALAEAEGLDYRRAYARLSSGKLESRARKAVRAAVERGEDVLLDRTNLRAATRRRFLRCIPAAYERQALVFAPTCRGLAERLRTREAAGGKVVPFGIAVSMLRHYDPPSPAEFDRIAYEDPPDPGDWLLA